MSPLATDAAEKTTDDVASYLELLGAFLRASLRGDRAAWTVDQWWAALAPLRPRERSVVILTVFDGLSQQDIADRWGVSRTRIYQLWHGAVARLSGCPRIVSALQEVTQ